LLTVTQRPSLKELVALAIGIGDYLDPLLGGLSDPKTDAPQISQQLKQLAF
jgi:hypothetical protein